LLLCVDEVEQKFGLTDVSYSLVMENDGAAIEDDEVLNAVASEDGHILMVLRNYESWSPAASVAAISPGLNEVCL
jgi:hypothetical protein